MIKHKTLVLFVAGILSMLQLFSQSRREWLNYGDAAFKNKDYISAAYFYQKVIDPSGNDSRDFIYPYGVRVFQPAPKIEGDSAAAAEQQVSTQKADSVNRKIFRDTSDRGKNIIEEIRYQYITHRIAEAYRLGYDYENAEVWYAKAVESPSRQYPNARYWYALMLMQNMKYQPAEMQFENFLISSDDKDPLRQQVEKNIISCQFAGDSTNIIKGVKVTELDSVFNSGTASFGANYFHQESTVMFSSARKGSTVNGENSENEIYMCDIYYTKRIDSTRWEKPLNLNPPVNSYQHEGASSMAFDKMNIFFTRWDGPGKEQCAIYMSKNMNGMWLQPMKLNQHVNMDGYKSMHPHVSPDGSILYFASDRPGGKGKLDIWYCTLDEFGNASPPTNVTPINTPQNETTPFFNPVTHTLYFSSEGHIGFGGLDVYKTYLVDSAWSVPKNMGMPINSSRDDNYFVLEYKEEKGFLSSDRKKCENCSTNTIANTGHCYRIYEVDNQPMIITVSGVVYSKEDNSIMPNALVTIKDVKEEKEDIYLITDDKGAYSTILREDMEYYLKSQKVRHFGDAASMNTKGLRNSKKFVKDFYLEPIPLGDIVIPGIEYDFNTAKLRPEAERVLDTIVDFLNLNDNIIIEINSHTDTRGNDKYNLTLSQARAQSCVDYLIAHGIPQERLVAKGYGESKPLVSDKEIAKMRKEEQREAAHQKNRRTAFRTLSEEFKPVKVKKRR